MPTKRRRHTITETEPVQRALALARSLEGPGVRDSALLRELIVLGAEAKAARAEGEEADAERRKRLRERFLRRTREGKIDVEALEEVRRTGWTPHV